MSNGNWASADSVYITLATSGCSKHTVELSEWWDFYYLIKFSQFLQSIPKHMQWPLVFRTINTKNLSSSTRQQLQHIQPFYIKIYVCKHFFEHPHWFYFTVSCLAILCCKQNILSVPFHFTNHKIYERWQMTKRSHEWI